MREVEREVIAQIRQSSNLDRLREALEALHQKLNHKEMDKLQDEKSKIDSRIETQRFASITQKQHHYERVKADFERINGFLEEKISGATKHARDMLQIDKTQEPHFFNDIYGIVAKSFKVDREPLKPMGG